MRASVYNSAIPQGIPRSVHCALHSAARTFFLHVIFFLGTFGVAVSLQANDWSVPEQQLARKIVAVTGPGAVALTIENRSSLGRRNSEAVQNGLRSTLEQMGLHLVNPERAAASIAITLSENPTSYVWVAQIVQGTAAPAVVMVSAPRTDASSVAHDAMPMTLRKTLLWSQDSPVLDIAVLEEGATPTRMAVLDAEKVSIYRSQGGKWQQEQTLEVSHAKPWPRDARGRLIPAKDHLLDAYLPGVTCHSNPGVPMTLNCRETDDPWPLVPTGVVGASTVSPITADKSPIAPVSAFFAPMRNFFTGALTPAVGKFTVVPKFYSAALLPREKYTLWFFAALDGQVHLVDGMNDQSVRFDWGTSITTLRTACGAGWQVLAASAGERTNDFVRAYEFPDRDPVAVTAPADLSGSLAALWTEAKGDSAIAIVRDEDTGSYDAFRLAVACSQ